MRSLLQAGLVGALKATNGWVLSAGTDSGVMRLAGQVTNHSTASGHVTAVSPLIGCRPWRRGSSS